MNFLKYLLLLICFNAYAEPIEFVVPAGFGGPSDVLTRRIANELPFDVVIINKPGAAHLIGYNYILNSDKPTLFVADSSIVGNPLLGKSRMIYELGMFSNLVFVSKSSGINSWSDLVRLSKKREINFGNGGVGTHSYRAMEEACEQLRCLSVPFKSGSDGMLAMLNGTIDAYALVSYGAETFLSNPNYKVIRRIVPTNGDNWVMLFSKNLPSSTVSDIVKVVSKMDRIK